MLIKDKMLAEYCSAACSRDGDVYRYKGKYGSAECSFGEVYRYTGKGPNRTPIQVIIDPSGGGDSTTDITVVRADYKSNGLTTFGIRIAIADDHGVSECATLGQIVQKEWKSRDARDEPFIHVCIDVGANTHHADTIIKQMIEYCKADPVPMKFFYTRHALAGSSVDAGK